MRRFACQRYATWLKHLQLQEASLNCFRDDIIADALQHFAEDDIGEPKALAVDEADSLEQANEALHAIGVRTELDLEREAAASL